MDHPGSRKQCLLELLLKPYIVTAFAVFASLMYWLMHYFNQLHFFSSFFFLLGNKTNIATYISQNYSELGDMVESVYPDVKIKEW